MKKRLFIVLGIFFLSCKHTQKMVQKPYPNQKNKVVTIYSNPNIHSALSEPSICIDKTNPDNVFAGSIYNNFHYSSDGGKTWKTKPLHSKYGVYGDPCLVSDDKGHIYFVHLSNPDANEVKNAYFIDRIVVQRTDNQGKDWSIDAGVGFHPPKQQDKHWLGIDPVSGALALTWTEFDKYGSKNPADKSKIMFSRSDDFGKTWSKPLKINQYDGDCLDDDNTTEGAIPVFDKQGNIFVAWGYKNKIYFDKSTDGGKTWLDNDIVIANQPQGWAIDIPGVYRANGMPVLDIDNSNSKYKGTLYVNWADQRNGKDNTDIFIAKSTDGGLTWSNPLKVNKDNTETHQYLTWMKVDPVTGYIYIVYYDRSRYKDKRTDVTLSVSTDGGKTFTQQIISDKAFIPYNRIFIGDYNNIDAYNGIVTPVWTYFDKKKGLFIKTTRIVYGR